MSVGKSVRLFLADGTPGGLLTAEIMNWTGHVVAAPRSDLATLLKRSESSRTGVYILLGDDPNSLGGQTAYIGEGDDIAKRLYQHARPEELGGKDFWDRAIVLTSKDANLTKAHARYLESRFIALAQLAKRAHLVNGTAPTPITLPEADQSDMEYFIAQAKILLPVLGVNLLRSAATATEITAVPASDAAAATTDSPLFELHLKKEGIIARAREIDGEFTVLAGSGARAAWMAASHHGYKALREQLIQEGALVPANDSAVQFAHDQVFASPSAAAAVIAGRSANGRIEWKVQGTGISYGSWQNQAIEQPAEEVTT
ncbi:GIY-YIG nuclease family protein [Mycobacteroides abscessus]|uniref:GIY-YIG nuclease family protein n=1 Tax=Mycobacteroides abscessus TaxID=36809 RepID=UPI00266C6F36|nr:GIY-YIG nuclease family protein [Mycobacteroides abscessus]MDO3175902.1 GIY-YIG nuclease family protein [Mycobacteroides abscessus subsp. abscessus]